MTNSRKIKRLEKTHNQSSHGGARVGAGAPQGNDSARKSPAWLAEYDLDTFGGVDNFTKELLKQTWTGDLGTRQSGNCLSILRLLLERRLWLPSGSDHINPEDTWLQRSVAWEREGTPRGTETGS